MGIVLTALRLGAILKSAEVLLSSEDGVRFSSFFLKSLTLAFRAFSQESPALSVVCRLAT